jgi:cyclomaltodextrin glucanotransferase
VRCADPGYAIFEVKELLQPGRWHSAIAGNDVEVHDGGALQASVPAHDVEVYLLDAPVTDARLRAALDGAMADATPRN